MRPTNSATNQYLPGQPPSDPAQMQRFLLEELNKIKAAYDALAAGHLDRQYSLPAKPRDGDLRYFDASIAPGGLGIGAYLYVVDAWVKL